MTGTAMGCLKSRSARPGSYHRQLSDAGGAPLHHHVSYLGIADLAAAVRERRLEARTLVERALALVDRAPGPRLEQLSARAQRPARVVAPAPFMAGVIP